jgi:hypothetical protein
MGVVSSRFGAVLYEMLSGKRVFELASTASVIAAVLERQPAQTRQSGIPVADISPSPLLPYVVIDRIAVIRES